MMLAPRAHAAHIVCSFCDGVVLFACVQTAAIKAPVDEASSVRARARLGCRLDGGLLLEDMAFTMWRSPPTVN